MLAPPRKRKRLRKIPLTVNNSIKAVIATLLNIQRGVERIASLPKGTTKGVQRGIAFSLPKGTPITELLAQKEANEYVSRKRTMASLFKGV